MNRVKSRKTRWPKLETLKEINTLKTELREIKNLLK